MSHESLPSPEATAALLRGRRTIHDFQPEAPPRERILDAIELARWAPNHRMTQPWHFTLLGPETAAAIIDLNAEIVAAKKGADAGEAKRRRWSAVPGWLLVSCDRSDDPLTAQEDYAATCCAIHNLSLALWSHGIGMKWTTGAVTRDPRFHVLVCNVGISVCGCVCLFCRKLKRCKSILTLT